MTSYTTNPRDLYEFACNFALHNNIEVDINSCDKLFARIARDTVKHFKEFKSKFGFNPDLYFSPLTFIQYGKYDEEENCVYVKFSNNYIVYVLNGMCEDGNFTTNFILSLTSGCFGDVVFPSIKVQL